LEEYGGSKEDADGCNSNATGKEDDVRNVGNATGKGDVAVAECVRSGVNAVGNVDDDVSVDGDVNVDVNVTHSTRQYTLVAAYVQLIVVYARVGAVLLLVL